MSNHWGKSQIPYFPVISDLSQINHETNEFIKQRSYPEIKYVFQDDELYKDLDNLDQDDEEGFIVELDSKGENIINCRAINADHVGVLGIKMKDKDSTKTIEIEITRNELKNTIHDGKSIDQLINVFKERNEQIEKVIAD